MDVEPVPSSVGPAGETGLVFEIKEALDVDRESEEIEEKKIELSREVFFDGNDWENFLTKNEMERGVLTKVLAATDKETVSTILHNFPPLRDLTARLKEDKKNLQPQQSRGKKDKEPLKIQAAKQPKHMLSHRFVTQVGEKCLRLGTSTSLPSKLTAKRRSD
jgi:hypothetical protein